MCQKKPRYWEKNTQTGVQKKNVKLKESMEVKQGWYQARASCSQTDSVDHIVDRGVGLIVGRIIVAIGLSVWLENGTWLMQGRLGA